MKARVKAAATEPTLRIEVVVRNRGLELAENEAVIAKIPKVDGAYDLDELSEHVVALKRRHPDHDGATVLLEPDIAYDHLIQVMDVVRSAALPAASWVRGGQAPFRKAEKEPDPLRRRVFRWWVRSALARCASCQLSVFSCQKTRFLGS